MTKKSTRPSSTSNSTAPWPTVPADVEKSILELLTAYLEIFEISHSTKGKRKRRLTTKKKESAVANTTNSSSVNTPSLTAHRITVGYNSTVRRLEQTGYSHDKQGLFRPLGIVFISQNLPSVMTQDLHLLATLNLQNGHPIRVVPLLERNIAQLLKALDQPRLAMLGIEQDHEGLRVLQSIIDEQIPTHSLPSLRI